MRPFARGLRALLGFDAGETEDRHGCVELVVDGLAAIREVAELRVTRRPGHHDLRVATRQRLHPARSSRDVRKQSSHALGDHAVLVRLQETLGVGVAVAGAYAADVVSEQAVDGAAGRQGLQRARRRDDRPPERSDLRHEDERRVDEAERVDERCDGDAAIVVGGRHGEGEA